MPITKMTPHSLIYIRKSNIGVLRIQQMYKTSNLWVHFDIRRFLPV